MRYFTNFYAMEKIAFNVSVIIASATALRRDDYKNQTKYKFGLPSDCVWRCGVLKFPVKEEIKITSD